MKDNKVRIGNGSNSTTLVSASSGGALTLTMPSGSGSSNYYLKTDGSGNLSWSAVENATSYSSITQFTDNNVTNSASTFTYTSGTFEFDFNDNDNSWNNGIYSTSTFQLSSGWYFDFELDANDVLDMSGSTHDDWSEFLIFWILLS